MELVQGNLRLPLRASEADDRKPRGPRGFFYGGSFVLTKNRPWKTSSHTSAHLSKPYADGKKRVQRGERIAIAHRTLCGRQR